MRFAPNFKEQLKNSLSVIGLGVGFFSGFCIYSGNVNFYHNVVMPVSHVFLPPERAHRLSLLMCKYGLYPRYSNGNHPELQCNVLGLKFSNPIGVAAGFDKQGECPLELFNMGFSHVEIGSVTPEPQPGNKKPRVFRLKDDQAIINRFGFNSDGHTEVYNRLKALDWKGKGIIGVNLGINKTSITPVDDYVKGVNLFGELADYLVINVSSPNTPFLRNLQRKESLKKILSEVLKARNNLKKITPLLLKISPDESDESLIDIVSVVMDPQTRIDGLIVSNTTISRADLTSRRVLLEEAGGLSGKPLSERSTKLIALISSLTNKSIPIIGVGGVDSGMDAWKKLMAGASLVQLYTSMVYYGPPIAKKVVEELSKELSGSQYSTVEELLMERHKDDDKTP